MLDVSNICIKLCCEHGHFHAHAGMHEKKLPSRKIPFTKSQTEMLMKCFQATVYPKKKEIDELAKSFNVRRTKIESWFSLNRLKLRKKGMLPQSE